MASWIHDALPYAFSIGTALVTAAVGASPLTTRRLRQGLMQDAAVLQVVRGPERDALYESMRNRTAWLAAYARFPILVGRDYVRIIFVIFTGLLTLSFGLYPLSTESKAFYLGDIGLPLVPVIIGLFTFNNFQQSWRNRRIERSAMLRTLQVSIDSNMQNNALDFHLLTQLFGALTLIAPYSYFLISYLYRVEASEQLRSVVVFLAIVAGAGFLMAPQFSLLKKSRKRDGR